ncbi:2-dehydropantoate 2-reductase [Aquabacterium sp.]|uniref:ketopantoate reductase family protein n=1 Tax=Aquabacterium sp. TaxID=1872578 RepID=UPI0025B852AF|nr:2-dehydropantoate 2-reductase [Aquabacterium sp.]
MSSSALASFQHARILIAGAGAIGCTLAARLAAAGHDVSVLARGRTLQALRDHGVHLDDLEGQMRVAVRAVADVRGLGAQDLVLLCSKSQDLADLAEQAQPAIGPDTVILPLVNGVPFWFFHRHGGRFEGETVRSVDPDGRLRALLPPEQVLGAVVFVTAEATEPGRVTSRTPHLLMLGEPGGGLSERLERVCALVRSSGIEARPLERIRDKLWTKLIANLTSNPLSVLTGATLGEIYSDPRWLPTVKALMHEVMLTASAYGARLEIDPIEFLRLGAEMGDVRTSMLQDHERGRPLELAAIGDAIVELAQRYEVPTPHTSELLARVRRMSAPTQARAA